MVMEFTPQVKPLLWSSSPSTGCTLLMKMYLKEMFSALGPRNNQESPGALYPPGLGISFGFLSRERPWKSTGKTRHFYDRLQSYKCMCKEYREHIKEKAKSKPASHCNHAYTFHFHHSLDAIINLFTD